MDLVGDAFFLPKYLFLTAGMDIARHSSTVVASVGLSALYWDAGGAQPEKHVVVASSLAAARRQLRYRDITVALDCRAVRLAESSLPVGEPPLDHSADRAVKRNLMPAIPRPSGKTLRRYRNKS